MSKKIIIQNSLNSLMPNGVYGSRFKKELLSHLADFDQIKSPSIFEDEISDDLINIWCAESSEIEKIKSVLALDSLEHESSIQLRKCLSKEKDGNFFFKDANFLSAIVIKNGKVQLQNKYEYNRKEDLLYFILLLEDQFKLKNQVFLMGNFEKELLDFVSSYVKDITRFEASQIKPIKIKDLKASALELCE